MLIKTKWLKKIKNIIGHNKTQETVLQNLSKE
jgi:hypothetical protein